MTNLVERINFFIHPVAQTLKKNASIASVMSLGYGVEMGLQLLFHTQVFIGLIALLLCNCGNCFYKIVFFKSVCSGHHFGFF